MEHPENDHRVSFAGYLRVLLAEQQYLWGLGKVLRSAYRYRPTFPALVEIQTVNRCNAACSMCPYPLTTARQPTTHMTDETYAALLAQLAREPEFKILVLSFQNEPLLDERLAQRARQFKELMPDRHLEIVTNGSLLAKDRLAELYASFDLISISVNAHAAATRERVFGLTDYAQVRETIDRIAGNPAWAARTVLRFVRQEDNVAEFGAFKRYWNRRGLRVFGFDANTRLRAVKPFVPGSGVPLSKRIKRFLGRSVGRMLMPYCTVPALTSYIRANGDVVLCFNDYSERSILGSVNSKSIGEVFNSAPVAAIRERVRTNRLQPDDVCADCDLYQEGIWATF